MYVFNQILNPKAQSSNPQCPIILNPQPSNLSAQPSTLSAQPSTLNPQHGRFCRDSWNREKLEVIIGAALEGPTLLDEVLTDMRDSRALDDGVPMLSFEGAYSYVLHRTDTDDEIGC